jgi:hypothetical protein
VAATACLRRTRAWPTASHDEADTPRPRVSTCPTSRPVDAVCCRGRDWGLVAGLVPCEAASRSGIRTRRLPEPDGSYISACSSAVCRRRTDKRVSSTCGQGDHEDLDSAAQGGCGGDQPQGGSAARSRASGPPVVSPHSTLSPSPSPTECRPRRPSRNERRKHRWSDRPPRRGCARPIAPLVDALAAA